MEKRIRFAGVLFTGIFIASMIFWGCSKQSSEDKTTESSQRPTLTKAEMAYEALQVQNTYSKHAYYHAIPQLYCQELEDIWVKQGGPNDKTASWRNAGGIWEGMSKIKDWYCNATTENLKISLEAISRIYPEIKNVPENLGTGAGWAIHTQTTPIIEVAGDGKTAKGLWYSPGIMANTVINNGKVEVSGGWFWEKYGVDFIKEDGEWKIWHIGMYYDPTPPGWGAEMSMTGEALADQVSKGGENEAQKKIKELMAPTRPNPDPYKSWEPKSVMKLEPPFPDPYYTFSETFSY
jgi:hypothetical protein